MFIVVLAYFFDQMDGTVVGYVAPLVIKTFGITIQEFAPAQSLYFIGMMLGGIVAGFISDKIGRRKAFLCGCSMFTLATILTGFTNDIKWFTIFRVLTGFGVLGTGAICTTYLSEVLSANDRSKYYGICTGLGLFAVPAIGVVSTWVIPLSDEAWRYLFWQGTLGLLPLTLGFVFMRESPRWLIAQGRQAEAEAVVEEYCGEKIDLTEVAERARIEKNTRPSFTETLRQIFIFPKYRYRSLILFFIAAGQNIPSFVLLGWNTTLLQANGVDQASSLIISTIGSIGSPIGTIFSGYIGTFGGRKLSIGIQYHPDWTSRPGLHGFTVSFLPDGSTLFCHTVFSYELCRQPEPVHGRILSHPNPEYRLWHHQRIRPLCRCCSPMADTLPVHSLRFHRTGAFHLYHLPCRWICRPAFRVAYGYCFT